MPTEASIVAAWLLLVTLMSAGIGIAVRLSYLSTRGWVRVYRKRKRLERVRYLSEHVAERMTQRVIE